MNYHVTHNDIKYDPNASAVAKACSFNTKWDMHRWVLINIKVLTWYKMVYIHNMPKLM